MGETEIAGRGENFIRPKHKRQKTGQSSAEIKGPGELLPLKAFISDIFLGGEP